MLELADPQGARSVRCRTVSSIDPETRERLAEILNGLVAHSTSSQLRRRRSVAATSADRTTASRRRARSIDATTVGTVSLTVSDLDRSRTFYERAIGLRATELDDGALALGVAGETPVDRAARRQLGAAAEPARPRPLPPGDPGPDPARPGASAGPPGRDALAARRRLGPPGERGAVPVRPGRQRDRDLSRSPARRVAVRRRAARDGDAGARPRRRARRAASRDRAPDRRAARDARSATSTSRSPTCARPRRSTTACSGST